MPSNLLGPSRHKLQPKLQLFANGSAVVNTVRAEHCSSLAVEDVRLLQAVTPQLGETAVPITRDEIGANPVPGDLVAVPNDVQVNVFVHTVDPGEREVRIPEMTARKGNLMTATVPLSRLRSIAGRPGVTYVEAGEPLASPTPEISLAGVSEPSPSRWIFGSPQRHHSGQGVLIGIIDVQGFDFAHPDFLDEDGKTRFVRIWDQGGQVRPSPKDFLYGSEFRQEHLNKAIEAAPKLGVEPGDVEHQSQMELSSHGTHVASIAAGNHGICRSAAIAGVLISLPKDDDERRKSFYDSTRLAHAVDYLVALAEELKMPVSINISLGTNGHAHDASSAISRWIDSTVAVPGRSVCVAAGNAGQEVAAFDGDIGYVMGRIHASGQVAARALAVDIEWLVVGNGIADLSENELELWFSAQDRFAVSLRPPGAEAWIGPIEPREFVENQQLPDGSFVSIYNELYHPANGANYVSIYLSPFFSDSGVVGIPAGRWTVRVHGREVRDGRYHAWIERDDPRRLGRTGEKDAWRFPSYFSERSFVDSSTVSSLACGQRIVSVANLDLAAERVAVTSSQGPTRDGRFKPDVAAPGTKIVAANGFADTDHPWVEMSGTSMASPYVAGVVGLMLAIEPKLTGAQIEGIIQRTALPLPGANFAWLNDAGFGVIDPDACLAEAAQLNRREDRTQ